MEPSFVLDTGGAERISNGSNIIYCSSKSFFGGVEVEDATPAKSVITPRKFRRLANSKRYHENDKFSKIKPGCISSELREALHISHHDIPLHIYRMRSMGYPPGWLRKAKVEQLPFFDGELDINSSLEVKYDEAAIIAYPGFNVCSSKLRDECYALQCPSIQRRHLLNNFILSLRNSSTNILESSRYKESLESKDLNDLEGERQRLLSEINALKNSFIPASSDHSGADREKEMKSNLATAEACFLREFAQETAVAESVKEQLELESEEGTTIPSSITSIIANNSGDLDSAENQRNTPCAPKKLPKLEAFSSGIQPFEPYKNLPDAQGAYNRVRNTLKRAKSNPTAFARSEAQNEEKTRELPVSDGLTSRSESSDGRHGWRSATSIDSRLNTSSFIENRLRRSNRETTANQASDTDGSHYCRRHFRANLCIVGSGCKYHPKDSVLQAFDHATYRGPCPAYWSVRNGRHSSRERSTCDRYSRSFRGAQGNYFGHSTWLYTNYR